MDPIYNALQPEDAMELEQLARLLYEIRSARDNVLARLGAGDDAQALACIEAGELAEHPAYDDYLSARILGGMISQIRSEMAARLEEAQGR